MITKLKNWWKQQSRPNNFEQKLSEFEQKLGELEKSRDQALQQLDAYQKQDHLDKENQKNIEPWVEIKSADYNETKGIQIELDWNEAFIEYLKNNGIKGKDEDAIVQKWLAFMYEDLIEKLEDKIIDKSDEITTNEFE